MFGVTGRFSLPVVPRKRHSIVLEDGSTLSYDVFGGEGSGENSAYTFIVCPGIARLRLQTFHHPVFDQRRGALSVFSNVFSSVVASILVKSYSQNFLSLAFRAVIVNLIVNPPYRLAFDCLQF